MKKIAITSLICIISVLGIIQTGYAQEAKEIHTFNLQVFLEGPFNGTDMNTTIFDTGLLPSDQPYNIEPWNYFGGETLNVNPGDDVVDWVLVEFLESLYGPASATPDKIIHKEAALLMSDGSIVQTDGLSPLEFEADIQYYLYVIIRHRNHLAVLSANSVIPTKGSYSYNFTDDLSKAYLDGQKEIAPGVFGMAGGDCETNGIIENTDKDLCWTIEAGNMGYFPGDWNLNTQVNNPDKDDIWVVNLGMESMVPRAFECGDVIIDFRDDQTYNTILIGYQCWMAENLNIGVYTESVNTGYTHSDVSNNGIIEKYCYDNNINNCEIFGGLYDWNEMMCYIVDTATQGICPDGWHIPTNFEWKILEGTVDSQFGVGDPEWDNEGFRGSDAGLNLKSETGWSNNGNGTDAFGFTALPTGQRRNIGDFVGIDELATFWTSSPYPSTSWSWRRYLQYDHNDISNGAYYRERGISVRCLKTNLPPDVPSNPSPENGAINQPFNTTLSWTCTDPENDPLTYDVYFGPETDPPLFDEGISDPYYDPGILNYGIIYYWKIVAHDDHGNFSESDVWSFTTWVCGNPFVDPRDEQTYNTVLIGDQCWMAENLNIGVMINVIDNQTDNGVLEKYCYGNNTNNCDTYGGLYQWSEMMQYSTTPGTQGICPEGWHLPTDEEWKQLEGEVDSQYGYPDPEWDNTGWRGFDAGGNLKESGTTHWSSPNTGATNSSGFTALPGGYRSSGGSFIALTTSAPFWSSDESGSNAWRRFLGYTNAEVYRNYYAKGYGFSVRCLKTNLPPDVPSNPSPENGAINQPVNTTLSWTCTDPENDPLTYDIYFGTETDPPLLDEGISNPFYDPGILNYEITYYWKIVAEDDHGNMTTGSIWNFTTEVEPFTCGDVLVDVRDGQSYNTVQIGTQCWMAENLNLGDMIIGSMQTDDGFFEKYCYDNLESNCDTYGGLYQWDEMMQYTITQGAQGICPPYWHLPTDAEWCTLENEVDEGTVSCTATGWRGIDAGLNLKSTSGWNSGGNGTDLYGFTALPGGIGGFNFYYLGTQGSFWSSSTQSATYAWKRQLAYDYSGVYRYAVPKINGFSVRCLQD